jgi:hypothetical protein
VWASCTISSSSVTRDGLDGPAARAPQRHVGGLATGIGGGFLSEENIYSLLPLTGLSVSSNDSG